MKYVDYLINNGSMLLKTGQFFDILGYFKYNCAQSDAWQVILYMKQ